MTLSLGPQLRQHPFDFDVLLSIGLISQRLQRRQILCLQSFFASFDDHAALNPHLNTFCRLKARTFGNKRRGETRIAGSEDFVVEGLQQVRTALLR